MNKKLLERMLEAMDECYADTVDGRALIAEIHAEIAKPEINPCPYCTSENKGVRETYFDQTCEGCVKRMAA